VFRLSRSGVVEAVEVDVVGIRDGLAVVVGDLAAGDPVAVDGSHRLRHGDLVESR
jgi:multidrug efflux pump subunit AcrA (membrane-fusion protein)